MIMYSLHINTMSIWLIYYNTLVVYSLLTSLSRNNMILCRSSTCPMINLPSSSMLLLSSSTSSSFDDNSIILDPTSDSVDVVKISPLINGDHYSLTTSDILSLESIRSTLVRQEETIIFALIERAQYRRNYDIYDAKTTKLRNIYGAPLSFLEWMLLETEKLHAKVRRYTSPEEHPFYEALLPSPVLAELNFPQLLKGNKSDVNVNAEIMRWYHGKIIDRLCVTGDDEQHGSSVLCDINALQSLSRRIHFGKFVAESKYLQDPIKYTELIQKRDVYGVLKLLTNVEVEKTVLRRAYVKAARYGQDITGTTAGFKIDPMLIVDIYRDMIIPLTKDVEVRYLFHRLNTTPPSPDEYYEYCRAPVNIFEDGSNVLNVDDFLHVISSKSKLEQGK